MSEVYFMGLVGKKTGDEEDIYLNKQQTGPRHEQTELCNPGG